MRARVSREADVGAQLSHPNIVAVYRRGSTPEGGPWIAMQYIDGTDADTALRQGLMTPARAVHIVGEIAKALEYAHNEGVVHGDVKPENFLLSGAPGCDERVFLSDFGIAHAPKDDHPDTEVPILATVAYTAPEVLKRQSVDGRADLYALGCSLFQMLTGSLPHQGDTKAVIRSHLESPPPKVTAVAPGLPSAFDHIIARALAKDPADRFQSGYQFASAALAALRPNPVSLRAARLALPAKATAPHQMRVTRPPLPPLPPGPPPLPSGSPSRPESKERSRLLNVVGAVLGSAVLIGVTAVLATGRASNDSSEASSASLVQESDSTSPATRNSGVEARLLSLLPPGYAPDACHPVDPTEGAQAKVTCSAPFEPGGAASVNYLLIPDAAKLKSTFDRIVQQSTVVTCPGNIQSPGPWRRNATPQSIAGTVFCGFDPATAIVGWSTDDQMLITVVQAPTGGPNLDQLYGWWSTHS
jgi:serine/threonine-protein kinase